MKKFIVFFAVLFFMSCGNSGNKEKSTDSAKTEVKDPEAAKGLDLMTKSDCFTCHKLNDAAAGPPYTAVANKYKVLNDATMDSMVTQIMKGGKGKWGSVPMMPHPQISKEDAQSMVHYIMSMKE